MNPLEIRIDLRIDLLSNTSLEPACVAVDLRV
jgi:hypothetical protein